MPIKATTLVSSRSMKPQGQLVMKQYSPRGGQYLGAKLRDRLRHTMPDVYDRVVILSALSDDKYLALLKVRACSSSAWLCGLVVMCNVA